MVAESADVEPPQKPVLGCLKIRSSRRRRNRRRRSAAEAGIRPLGDKDVPRTPTNPPTPYTAAKADVRPHCDEAAPMIPNPPTPSRRSGRSKAALRRGRDEDAGCADIEPAAKADLRPL